MESLEILLADIDRISVVLGKYAFWFSFGISGLGVLWWIIQLSMRKGQGLINWIKINFNPVLFSVIVFTLIGIYLSRGIQLIPFNYILFALFAIFITSVGGYWLNYIADSAMEKGLNLPLTFAVLSFFAFLIFSFSVGKSFYHKYINYVENTQKEYTFNPPCTFLDSLEVFQDDTLKVLFKKGKWMTIVLYKKENTVSCDLDTVNGWPDFFTTRQWLLFRGDNLFNIYTTNPRKFLKKDNRIYPGLFSKLRSNDTTRLGNYWGSFTFDKDMRVFYSLSKTINKGEEAALGAEILLNKKKSFERTKIFINKVIIQKKFSLFLLVFLFMIFITNIKQKSKLEKEMPWLKEMLSQWGIKE